MKTVIKDIQKVMEKIHKAENGERIPVEEYSALKRERVRLCQMVNSRLAEINEAIRFAVDNKENRLPYNEYKKLKTERQSLRDALRIAEWTLNNPLKQTESTTSEEESPLPFNC